MSESLNIYMLFEDLPVYPVLERAAVERLERIGRVVRPAGPAKVWTQEQLAAWLADADVVLTGWGAPRLSAELLAGATRLRFIGHCAGTVAPVVDLSAWQRGVTVVSANSAMSSQVAEWAVTLASMSLRRWGEVNRELRGPVGWRRSEPAARMDSITHQTVGILGLGDVGRWAVRMFNGFDCRVLVTAPESADVIAAAGGTKVELDRMLSESRVVSLHAPLNDQTRWIMNAERLARLADGAVLVNTARGRLIDHDALLAECRSGRLSAALDVTEPEPLPADHPLWKLDNVIVSPHCAGPVPRRQHQFGDRVVADLEAFLAGEPLRGRITRDKAAAMTQSK
ncbi:MAG: Glyoxylate/hydroxypyruvate reductase B [Phycisphaerae bacterium]|nr:Glyoxylate/hydroxypyruvate reductase B [Phycisphaerae bacterium]